MEEKPKDATDDVLEVSDSDTEKKVQEPVTEPAAAEPAPRPDDVHIDTPSEDEGNRKATEDKATKNLAEEDWPLNHNEEAPAEPEQHEPEQEEEQQQDDAEPRATIILPPDHLTAEEDLGQSLAHSRSTHLEVATVSGDGVSIVNDIITELEGEEVVDEPRLATMYKLKRLLDGISGKSFQEAEDAQETLARVDSTPGKSELAHKKKQIAVQQIFSSARQELQRLRKAVNVAPNRGNEDPAGPASTTASRPMTPGGSIYNDTSASSAQTASLREQISKLEQERSELKTEIGALKRKLRDEERRWQSQTKTQQNEYFNELLAMKKDYNYELERVKLQKELECRQLKDDAEYQRKELIAKHQAELDNVQLQSAAQARQLEEEISEIISKLDPNFNRKQSRQNAPASPLPRVAQIRPKTGQSPEPACPATAQNEQSAREQERKKYHLPDYSHVRSRTSTK